MMSVSTQGLEGDRDPAAVWAVLKVVWLASIASHAQAANQSSAAAVAIHDHQVDLRRVTSDHRTEHTVKQDVATVRRPRGAAITEASAGAPGTEFDGRSARSRGAEDAIAACRAEAALDRERRSVRREVRTEAAARWHGELTDWPANRVDREDL
jgi:hypothetical protein